MSNRLTYSPVEGERVRLEPFRRDLITNRYLSWMQDEKVNKYLVSVDETTSLDDIRNYVSSLPESDLFIAVFDRKANLHIGNVRLQINISTRIGQYSMMIGDSSYHGQGYGTEIVALTLKIAFDQLLLRKVFCEVAIDNIPAIRVYEKNGFQVSKCPSKCFYKKTKKYDLVVMAKKNPSWFL